MKMSSHKLAWARILFFSVILAGACPLYAQDQQQPPAEGKTKPAGSTSQIPIAGTGDQQDQDTTPLRPDTTPLTGILNPTLGSAELTHSYWVPGVAYAGSIQSNSYNQTQSSGWLMNNYIVGNMSALKAWSRSQLSVNYSVGGFFTTDSAQGNGYYQHLAFLQSFQWNRWQLQLADQFSYLPVSSFGFGGATGLGTPGIGGSLGPVIPGMGGGTIPNQSIYASVGPRYSNSSAVQLTYATSKRGSFTFSGSYALLNFVDAGSVDNDSTAASIGYNYTLNRQDTIGVFYRFAAFHFKGQPQALGDHSVNVAYGRKITGRVALQLYAGPDYVTSRIAENGKSSAVGVNAGATLQYAIRNGGMSFSYSHGISGGSGVLTGSTGDQVNFGANHKLTQLWSGQLNVGYARNSTLPIATSGPSLTFNTWTAGGGANRPFGRNAKFALTYNAEIPDYGSSFCAGPTCTGKHVIHSITFNFQWHTRPFVLP